MVHGVEESIITVRWTCERASGQLPSVHVHLPLSITFCCDIHVETFKNSKNPLLDFTLVTNIRFQTDWFHHSGNHRSPPHCAYRIVNKSLSKSLPWTFQRLSTQCATSHLWTKWQNYRCRTRSSIGSKISLTNIPTAQSTQEKYQATQAFKPVWYKDPAGAQRRT